MLRRLFVVVFVFSYVLLTGQIGGITGSKINSFNHMPIDLGKAEFEPTYNYLQYSKQWDDDGKLQDAFASSDSLGYDVSLNLRMAYTFTTRLEFGCNLGIDYSNWSAKYALGTFGKVGLGVMAGANFPYGFSEINKKNREADQIGTYGLGLIFSYEINDKSSVDFNAQWQDYFQSNIENPNADQFLSVDYGYYVGDVLFMGSLFYQRSEFDNLNSYRLTFMPGISFEMKQAYMVVPNLSFDLLGKNIEKTLGFSVSFTMTL